MLAGNGRSAAAPTKKKMAKGSPRKTRKVVQETKATESVFEGKTQQMFEKFLDGANTPTVEQKDSPYENMKAFGITQPIQLRKSKSADMPMDGDSFDYDHLLNGYEQVEGGDRKTTRKSKKKNLESKDQPGQTTKVKTSRRAATVLTSVTDVLEIFPSERKNTEKTVQEKVEVNGKSNDTGLPDIKNRKESSKVSREERKTVTETLKTPAEKSQVSKAPTAETAPTYNANGQANGTQQMHQQYIQFYRQQNFRNFMLDYYRRRCYEQQCQQQQLQQQLQQQRQQMMQQNQGQQRRSQGIQNKSRQMYEMAPVSQGQEEQPFKRLSLNTPFGGQQARRAVMASIPSGDIRDRSVYGDGSQFKKRTVTKNKLNNQSVAMSTLCLFLFLSMISVWLYSLESRRSQETSPFEATLRGNVDPDIYNRPPFYLGAADQHWNTRG